jgi:hypothetical protein
MIRNISLVLVLAAAACGGKQPAPASTATAAQPAAGHDHAGMPAEVTKFHDVLAPRWHAEKGPQRMKDTCAAVADFQADADAIAKSTPPATANADTWGSSTKALVDSVAGLDTTCKANDTAKFEEAFHTLHENFHAVMAATGAGEKHEHGQHEHGQHQHGHDHQHSM